MAARPLLVTFGASPKPALVTAGLGGVAAVAVGATLAQAGPERGFLLVVGAVGAIALGLLALQRPDVGALVLVAVVPITSGIERGVPVPGFRLSEVLIGGLAGLILVSAKHQQRVPWRTFDWLAALYVITTVLFGAYDLVGRGAEFSNDNIGKLLGPFQFFLLYRAVVTALPTNGQRQLAVKLALVSTVPVAALAILQQVDLLGARAFAQRLTGADAASLSLDPSFVLGARASGPFPAWHTLGGYLFLAILLGVGLLLDRSVKTIRTGLLAPILVLAGVALVLTLTAAPMLGVIVGSVLLGLWVRRFGRVAVVVAAGLAVAVLLFAPLFRARYEQQFGTSGVGVPETLVFRYDVWTEQYLPFLSNRLATGYGPDTPPVGWGYTESVYITMLVRGGLPLLLVYLALMWALLVAAYRSTADNDPFQAAVARVMVVAVVMLVFMHFVSSYFVTSGLPHLMWALAGVLFAQRTAVRTGAEVSAYDPWARQPAAAAPAA
jgi:O-Antigen ligase